MRDKILLFIPMYNCEKQIPRVLGQLTDEVCGYLNEAVIINNRSTDQGETAVREYLRLHKVPLKVSLFRNHDNYGLGGSHKVVFQYAMDHAFDYVIVLHGDDQVSNVKMVNQAVTVLKLLGSYVRNKQKFVSAEHRDKAVEDYSAQLICTNRQE